MSGDRIARALARIETATRRIGNAAPVGPAQNLEISAQYETLRAEAVRAVAEMDALIAAHSG